MTSAPELRPSQPKIRDAEVERCVGLLLTGLVGVLLVVLPEITNGRLPGDEGDARFNLYILEHGYLWLTGQVPSFWNAPFFYPAPLTVAFSDNHLGTSFVYWALRAVGSAPEDAFRGWYLIGYVANFAASGYTLSRLGHGWLASALGAFFYTFALPVTAQDMHAQLGYRFGIPLALLALLEFERSPRLSRLLALGSWTVWQFYCSIYLGYFLSLLLGAFVIALALRRRGDVGLRQWPGLIRTAWRQAAPAARAGFLAASGALALLLVLLLLPYLRVSRLYGFRRSWDEIASMLPRLSSYLLADESRLWRVSWSGFDALPVRHEHQLFFGVAPWAAALLAVTLRWRGRARLGPLFVGAALPLVLLIGLTLSVGGVSLYHLITGLPGPNSIRAVTRIGLVLVFPVALMLAQAVDAIAGARIGRPAAIAALAALALLLVTESADIDHYVSAESAWEARLRDAAAGLPPDLPPSPILLLAPVRGEPPVLREVDGMLLAQLHGWATLNGYSGNIPPSHRMTGDCRDAVIDLSTALDALGTAPPETFDSLARRLVPVGYKPCARPSLEHFTAFAGPLPQALMAKISIAIERVELRDGQPVATVSIANRGDITLPAISTTQTPVRFSVQYFPAAEPSQDSLRRASWEWRQDLDIDVPPGAVRQAELRLPLPPLGGPYGIGVSLVQDGVAWFHNAGMDIAVSGETITRGIGLALDPRR